MKQSDEQVQMT